MKVSHIIIIVIIALSIGIIVSTTGDASKYVSFKEAREMAADGNTDKVHVVGKLKRTPSGEIMGMSNDPLTFTFYMVDSLQEEHQVFYKSPKPQDIERSEQVVVVGNFKENIFVADNILLKCPSKYNERKNEESL